jgi:TorA maturation chaperone TorD
MRDPSLDEIVRAAGGDGALAGKIQLSPSNWHRIPSDEADAARAHEYALLATLLRRAPDANLLNRLAGLKGDTSALGVVHAMLAEAASTATVTQIEQEFFDLFVGVGRGELVPYASYYLTGFINDRPLAKLRGDLAKLAIERVDTEFEPEDHVAILCEIMAGVVSGSFDNPPGADRALFENHLLPWIGRFFADLERAKAAGFYRHVAAVGRVFVAIEAEAFTMAS